MYMEWTEEMLKTLRRLAAKGASREDAAALMGVDYTKLRRAAHRHGVEFRGVVRASQHSPEVVRAIVDRMMAGESANQVAASLGLTRNAAIGIWHRNRPPHVRKRKSTRPRPAPKPRERSFLPGAPLGNDRRHESAVFRGPARVACVADLEPHHCRWPALGGFCGDARRVGSPYCLEHHARAHQEPKNSQTPNATASNSEDGRGIISR